MIPEEKHFTRYELHVSVPCLESHGRFDGLGEFGKAVLRWLTPKEIRARVQDGLLDFDPDGAVDGKVTHVYQGMTLTAWLE